MPVCRAAPKKGPDAVGADSRDGRLGKHGKIPAAGRIEFNLQQRPTLGQPLDIDIAVLRRLTQAPRISTLRATG